MARQADSLDYKIVANRLEEVLIDCDLEPTSLADAVERLYGDRVMFDCLLLRAACIRGISGAFGSLVANLYESELSGVERSDRTRIYKDKFESLLSAQPV